tara:strand:+ start:495 stop:995 length:501 start_codon:yes stop_codon:yes gene_type:complete
MTSGEYIGKNNQHLINQTKNICRGSDEYMDLYQSVIEQILSKPEKMDVVSDDEKLYYFISIVKTNWHSKTSPYQYQKHQYNKRSVEYNEFKAHTIPDDEPIELPTLDWVNKEIEKMDWFDRDLFTLWAELRTLTAVHKETTIPINSVGKYIKEIKQELNQRWSKTR